MKMAYRPTKISPGYSLGLEHEDWLIRTVRESWIEPCCEFCNHNIILRGLCTFAPVGVVGTLVVGFVLTLSEFLPARPMSRASCSQSARAARSVPLSRQAEGREEEGGVVQQRLCWSLACCQLILLYWWTM